MFSPLSRPWATTLVLLAVVCAVFVALLVYVSVVPSSSASLPAGPSRSAHDDGRLPDGVTVSDDRAALTRLDADLLRALRAASSAAADDGITLQVTSGWRSPAYQRQLLRDAVWKYGSEAEAARWVATPETSSHVSGDAVDVGPTDAMYWLGQHGARFGLCQVYGNEPWHFELRVGAKDSGCPQMYADATHDPRMR